MSIADEASKISEKKIFHTGQLDMLMKAEKKREKMIKKGLWKQTEQKVARTVISRYSSNSN